MLKRIGRLSLFVKALFVLVLTILITALLAFGFMYGEVRKVVTVQIKQGAEDALRIANVQLQERLTDEISLLISLRTDLSMQDALAQRPETPAQREDIAEQIRAITKNAYYAIDTPFKIAIVSSYDDVYANWIMVDTDAVLRLKNDYYDKVGTMFSLQSGLYSQIVPNVELSTGVGSVDAYYIQYLPLVSRTGVHLGVAMVLISEAELQSMIGFSMADIHTTMLLDQTDTIVSAQDKTLIGTDFHSYTAANGMENSHILFSEETARTRLTIVDIMSDDYIDAQVWQIMHRLLLYTLLSITGVSIAAYFLMRGITRPLKNLTARLISSDYSSFAQKQVAGAGKNEILLLESGFAEMEEDIRTLLALNEREQREKRSIEIAALQAQIQPHFLFNTLNTVRCSILNHHNEKAAELIYDLTALLRMTLINGDELVTLEQEVETIGYYLDIIKMRHAADFVFTSDLSSDTAQLQVPKLLLQPLVENCVIHGFKQQQQDGCIVVRSFRDGPEWCIQVKNNGEPLREPITYFDEAVPERPAVTRDSFSGIGTQNVYRRLCLYYGESSSLRIYTDKDGLTINELRIPYRPAGESFDRRGVSPIFTDTSDRSEGGIHETKAAAGR